MYGALLVLLIPVLVIQRGSTLLSTLCHLGPTNDVGIELHSSGTGFRQAGEASAVGLNDEVSGLRPMALRTNRRILRVRR